MFPPFRSRMCTVSVFRSCTIHTNPMMVALLLLHLGALLLDYQNMVRKTAQFLWITCNPMYINKLDMWVSLWEETIHKLFDEHRLLVSAMSDHWMSVQIGEKVIKTWTFITFDSNLGVQQIPVLVMPEPRTTNWHKKETSIPFVLVTLTTCTSIHTNNTGIKIKTVHANVTDTIWCDLWLVISSSVSGSCPICALW